MKGKFLGLLAAALMAGPIPANAQYVYTYTGADFDSFGSNPTGQPGNPYTASDQLTFRLTTSAPLPANLGNFQGNNPLDFQGVGLVSLTASDGVQSHTYSASNILPGGAPFTDPFILGFLTTNSAGKITSSYVVGQSMSGRNLFTWSSDFPLPGQPSDTTSIGSPGSYFYAVSSGIGKWTSAPEIDAASAAGGLTLLFSGLAMTPGARRSRSPERRKR